MFKLLLKKQLFEVFRSWFYNGKTGKARSKKSTILMATLFLLLIVGVFGGSFTAIAIGIAQPLYQAGVGYLYFILFGLMALAIGLFGSVFNTYSGLYLAKDNDLLLSLPIQPSVIVIARLCSTYLMGLMYASSVMIPATVVWQIATSWDFASFVGQILMLLEISLVVWVLSCVLGFGVAKISLKLKKRSFVTVVAALCFMGLYYFVYFKAQVLIRDMVNNAAQYGEKIRGSAYVLYAWGQSALGGMPEIILFPIGCIFVALLTWLLLSRTFLRIATSSSKEKKATTTIERITVNDVSRALLKKEFSRFTSSSNYMLNCGLGCLFITIGAVIMLVKGNSLFSSLLADSYIRQIVPVGIVGMTAMLASMNDSASPSVSLEGNNLWIAQSLPVHPWQVIVAKMKVQIYLTEIPMILLCIGIAILPISATEKITCIIFALIYPLLSSLFNMFIGLKMPIIHWENEIIPIKQSGCVAIALFGGWGYAALLVGGYVGLISWFGMFSPAIYLCSFIVLSLAICILLYRWLKTSGSKTLATL